MPRVFSDSVDLLRGFQAVNIDIDHRISMLTPSNKSVNINFIERMKLRCWQCYSVFGKVVRLGVPISCALIEMPWSMHAHMSMHIYFKHTSCMHTWRYMKIVSEFYLFLQWTRGGGASGGVHKCVSATCTTCSVWRFLACTPKCRLNYGPAGQYFALR